MSESLKRELASGFPRLVQASLLAHAPGDRAQHGVGHAGELAQGLVPVLAGTEVDLRHSLEPHRLQYVYHDPGLHRVAGEEWDGSEELPVSDELAREWLHEARELGVEQVEEWLGRELRHPPAAVRLHRLVALEGTPVGGLDEADPWYLQDRAEDAVDKLRPEVLVSASMYITRSPRATESARHIASPLPWAPPWLLMSSFSE